MRTPRGLHGSSCELHIEKERLHLFEEFLCNIVGKAIPRSTRREPRRPRENPARELRLESSRWMCTAAAAAPRLFPGATKIRSEKNIMKIV